MEWLLLILPVLVLAAIVGLKLTGSVSVDAAREYLRQGARVIDVRDREEYRVRHLPSALNIPLGELTASIGRHVPNKDEVLLLHCVSGGRSGLGTRKLRGLGYRRVYNLGSLGRAGQIVAAAGPGPHRPMDSGKP